MFNEKQIEYMKSIGLNMNFDNLSDDDLIKIEDVVSERLQVVGFDEDDKITTDGKMCESILDELE